MNMKEHMLAALQEQFERWQALLASLSEGQLTAPRFDLDWSIKDVIAHLWAWQQISIARMEAGALDREPKYPQWILDVGQDWEDKADQVNAITFAANHEKPWTQVYAKWEIGFRQFLELGKQTSEKDLLDADRYPWLKGHSLVFILVASYDHHQEHFEKLRSWLQEHGN